MLVSGSYDNTLKVWDPATGAEKCTLGGHSGDVNCCAFSPDGKTVVSGSNDRTLKLWDPASGAPPLTLCILGSALTGALTH